ncbi:MULTISPECIES: hypothetical protein [Microcystis]|jgi:hypothetical protein|uniref:hypothetical protein n=1 Tax=Microcystis TaxID=1125 RepID=UPI0002F435F3|nr:MULTISPECIES: hypothetical protein [Microcystis]MBE9090398.1 hypothetical protein [Microcystis aeruginosa LEGE 11464]MCA2658520.1 hypothetical protein [Microcystis sp. M049S2]MCZ8127808.1 hypothetical protein [Microcystis sp. LE19-114.1B]MDB9432672.1 hypothetical protein [Microcystis aeruginosa CS-552/01]
MGADLQRIGGDRTGIITYTRSPIEYTFISAKDSFLKNLKISLRFLAKENMAEEVPTEAYTGGDAPTASFPLAQIRCYNVGQ